MLGPWTLRAVLRGIRTNIKKSQDPGAEVRHRDLQSSEENFEVSYLVLWHFRVEGWLWGLWFRVWVFRVQGLGFGGSGYKPPLESIADCLLMPSLGFPSKSYPDRRRL